MPSTNFETVYVCGACRNGWHDRCFHDVYLDDGAVAECACSSEDHMLTDAALSWVCDMGNYWLVEVGA
jgi:hypothetical protein